MSGSIRTPLFRPYVIASNLPSWLTGRLIDKSRRNASRGQLSCTPCRPATSRQQMRRDASEEICASSCYSSVAISPGEPVRRPRSGGYSISAEIPKDTISRWLPSSSSTGPAGPTPCEVGRPRLGVALRTIGQARGSEKSRRQPTVHRRKGPRPRLHFAGRTGRSWRR
jgi:hypothetical protein